MVLLFRTRLMRSALAATLLCAILASPVAALAADDVDMSVLGSSSACKKGEKKCVFDMQRRWRIETEKFEQSLEIKKRKWKLEHPQEVSVEWRALQSAFTKQIHDEAVAYREAQRAREKAFYDAFKKLQTKGDSRLNATGSTSLLPGQENCDLKGNPQIYRICMREYRIKFMLKERSRDRTQEDTE